MVYQSKELFKGGDQEPPHIDLYIFLHVSSHVSLEGATFHVPLITQWTLVFSLILYGSSCVFVRLDQYCAFIHNLDTYIFGQLCLNFVPIFKYDVFNNVLIVIKCT